MKVLIIGNIGSGKSTIMEVLQEMLGFKTVQIDKLRIEYSDGSFAGEYLAWSKFLEACENSLDMVLEFSGAGVHRHAVKQALSKSAFKVIFVSTSVNTCLKRVNAVQPLTPYPWKSNINETIIWLDDELRKLINSNFWNPNLIFDGEVEFEMSSNQMEELVGG